MQKIKTRIRIKTQHPETLYSLLLIIALCLFGSESKLVVAFVLLAFMPLIFKPEYLIGPLLFSTAWESWFLLSEGQTFTRYFTILFLFSVFLKFIYTKQKIKVDFWFISVIIAVILGIVLSMFGSHGYTSMPISFVLAMLLLLAMLYCPVKSKEDLIQQIWWFTIIGIAFACFLILRNGLDVFEAGRFGVETEESVYSNAVGKSICTLALGVFAHFLIRNFKGKILHISMLLVSLFLIFLTGSRNALLAFIIAAVICLIYWLKLNSRRLLPSILLIAVILVAIYYIYNGLMDAFPKLMDRFTVDNVIDSGGTGRTDIWRAYFRTLFGDYWLFGLGFDPNNLYHAVQDVNGIGHGAHNHIVDIIASTGIVGFILFMGMHVMAYKISLKTIRQDATALIPFAMLTATLLLGIGENVLRGRSLWFSTALVIIFYRLNREEDKIIYSLTEGVE